MALTNQDINLFVQKASGFLQTRVDESRNKVNKQFESFVEDALEEDWALAVAEKINYEVLSDNYILPPYVRIGSLTLPRVDDKAGFPMLLPLKGVNAYLFDFGKQSGSVPVIMQNIMFRLLLSLRLDLLKVSMVDMDLGNDFPLLNAIDNKHIVKTGHYDEADIRSLIDSLTEELLEMGKKLNVSYRNLDDYNAHNVVDQRPYHLVFIDDFPKGFTHDSFNRLSQLIHNGNARKAGILFFINYCGTENMHQYVQSGFNTDRFFCDCGSIVMNDHGELRLNGLESVDIDGLKYRPDTIDVDVMKPFLKLQKSFVPPERIFSLDAEWTDAFIKKDMVGTGSTIVDGVTVPAGFVGPTELFNFSISNPSESTDYFALVAGDPGAGKTTMVKNIIINAALKYPPDELNFYLIDFANGVSFQTFKGLRHVKALMLANSKEYAIRMLDKLQEEVGKRLDEFKKASLQTSMEIDDFVTYRKVTGEKMPYILLVMDEFHVLFNATDELSAEATKNLSDGIKQWRKVGIGIMFCTQSIGGVKLGSGEDHITYRFAFHLSPLNSKAVLHNQCAANLPKKWKAIMNNSATGDESQNVVFHSSNKEDYPKHMNLLKELYGMPSETEQYICEDRKGTDMATNLSLRKLLESQPAPNVNDCDIYVGRPDLLRNEHSRLHLCRMPESNILVLGNDIESLVRIQAAALLQIEAQSATGSKVYIIDAFNSNDAQYGVFDHLPEVNECVKVVHMQQTQEVIDEVWDELQRRRQMQQENKNNERRIVFSILNANNCYPLRRSSGGFMPELSQNSKRLKEILVGGPMLGIHVMLHSFSMGEIFGREKSLDYDVKECFSNVILMTNSGVSRNEIICETTRRPEVDQKGRVLVLNKRIDNEPYELCKVYDKCSIKPQTNLGHYVVEQYFAEEQ